MYKERELDVSMKCVKYMLFVANFMFVLVGFLLISIGSTVKAIYSGFDFFMTDNFYSASNLAIIVGFIIFVVALFGCAGAIKESVCLINTYALFLLVVLVLEICISIVAYAMRTNLEVTIRNEMYSSMNYYNHHSQFTWNATQYNLNCCGVEGPDDWTVNHEKYQKYLVNVTDPNNYTYWVPTTCCDGDSCTNFDKMYRMGCLTRITNIVSECALLLGIGAACVSFIQLLGVVFAHLLAKSVRKLKTQLLVEKSERRQALYEQLAKNTTNQEKVSPVLYTPTSSEA